MSSALRFFFAGLPVAVYRLTNLQHLEAANNQITDVDLSITQLVNLNVLDLSNNSLTRIPFEMGHMTTLRQLSLQGNILKAIPRNVLDKNIDFLLNYLRNKIPA